MMTSKTGRGAALAAVIYGVSAILFGRAAADPFTTNSMVVASLAEVTRIYDTFAVHGIEIQQRVESVSLPPGLTPVQVKAAQALKAIADSEVRGDITTKTRRVGSNKIAMVGGFKRDGAMFEDVKSLWSLDGKLLVAEYRTTFKMEGTFPAWKGEEAIGPRMRLVGVLRTLPVPVQNRVNVYISQNSGNELD
ncbi:hypothetical protein [Heyndrickxia sporothermodurans]